MIVNDTIAPSVVKIIRIRHVAICKGEEVKLECEKCLQIFKHKRSLHRHSKICSVKNKGLPPNIIIHNQTNNNIKNPEQ
jgi:hypothetical protein